MDKRVMRTREALKDALAELLGKKALSSVSVSELCSKAGVSRSTFYCNYQNVAEIFDELVVDFMRETRSLKTQLHCRGCHEDIGGRLPYCIAVRTTEKYRSVVRDDAFLPAMMKVMEEGLVKASHENPYLELGIPEQAANNVMKFQMAGCHMAALSERRDRAWEETQKAIDAFIAGGINGLRFEREV